MTIGSLSLNPTFDTNVSEYTATTTNNTNVINATAEDASISITLKNSSDDNKSITNGNAITWAKGENTVTITVSKDGVEGPAVYKAVVTKE